MLTNRLNMVLLQQPESKRQSMKWKYTDSPVKKKVPGAAVSKEGYADSLLEHERSYHY